MICEKCGKQTSETTNELGTVYSCMDCSVYKWYSPDGELYNVSYSKDMKMELPKLDEEKELEWHDVVALALVVGFTLGVAMFLIIRELLR